MDPAPGTEEAQLKAAALLGVKGSGDDAFANMLLGLSRAMDEPSECDVESQYMEIRQGGWRLARGLETAPPLYEIALDGLLEGLLNAHNRFLRLERIRAWPESGHVWHLA